MINLLRSLIRLGTITQLFNRYGIIRSQASFLDSQAPENIIHLQPYGFNACPPVGSQIITMSVYGHAEHKYGIPINATDANIQKLQAGETVIYNQVGTKIYLKADGNIEITPNGSSVIINSDLLVNGNVDVSEVYKVDGTQVVGEQQPAITPPSGGGVVDAQARLAINEIITTMQTHGLIA